MGISEGGDEGGGIAECSVGTIVWVRRRNGSWWPGRILGPEELSASHLMSPRSGTPVKLLGREDASVDWYNLEKSKRVKAFRCGEFDACIERAEASQGVPIKKREKYARREDAILHALELEKKQLEMKYKNQDLSINGIVSKPSGALSREFNNSSFSEMCLRSKEPGIHSKFPGHKSKKLLKRAAWSQEETNRSNIMLFDESRTNTQCSWEETSEGKGIKQFKLEEDTSEAIPRMRGLQDFGLRIAAKRKLSPAVTWETSGRSVDQDVNDFPHAENTLGDVNLDDGGKSMLSKKKRSQSSMFEESLAKKRDRRRPLVQVLRSTSTLPVPHSFQPDHDSSAFLVKEEDTMDVPCQAKRNRNIQVSADSDDSLSHNCFPSEQMLTTGADIGMENYFQHLGSSADEYTSSSLIRKNESDSSASETDTDTEETELLEDSSQSLVPSSMARDPSAFRADASADLGVSKWHMKGKRNNRNVSKRPMDVTDGKIRLDKYNTSAMGSSYQSKKIRQERMVTPSGRSRGPYRAKEELDYEYDEVDSIENDIDHSQVTGYGGQRYPDVLKTARDHGGSRISFNDSENDFDMVSGLGWEADGSSHISRRPYWDDSGYLKRDYATHLRHRLRPMLIDVDLKVQASYQGEHVPLVSLMSRLNGKAIIGHPVQIEILEDGSTDLLVSDDDAVLDKSTAPPPVWRTGRRTTMHRIPRSNPATSTLEGNDDGTLMFPEREIKPTLKRYSNHFNHQARLVKKSISHARRPSSVKFQKKPIKRVSLPSQKIRTLSSIATEQKFYGENGDIRLSSRNDILGGLIKPDGVVPLVTCVPAKVVFSRIMEAVGRPSLAVTHRVRTTSPALREPS
ncbi:uncharacterized protein [Typha latifolia]|uniref:uncharacterized protein n=1 Tax=Typha latifolia TaxID=4733 RepID=UPI003C2EB023